MELYVVLSGLHILHIIILIKNFISRNLEYKIHVNGTFFHGSRMRNVTY